MYRSAADELGFSAGGQAVLLIKETVADGLETISNGSFELKEALLDKDGEAGTAGQVLVSTGGTTPQTDWVDAAGPLKGIGKVNLLGGTLLGGTPGFSVMNMGNGMYDVSIAADIVSTSNYTIQLTVEGDFRIYVTAQSTTGFSVEIKNMSDTLTNARWHFTVLEQ
jgi:hypothetical protein